VGVDLRGRYAGLRVGYSIVVDSNSANFPDSLAKGSRDNYINEEHARKTVSRAHVSRAPVFYIVKLRCDSYSLAFFSQETEFIIEPRRILLN